MLWIFATLVAAAAQTARNAMQSNLTASLGTLGATQVRFLYGFPFALVFLALVTAVARASVPGPTAAFIVYTSAGALAQIFATALMLAAMRARAFSVAIAFTKTEPVQVALFGFLFLGEVLTSARLAAIAIATIGVVVVAAKPGTHRNDRNTKPALFGVASGGLFALAAVGFRGGILALGDAPYFLRATTTLVWSLGIQSFLLGAWLLAFDRAGLARSIAVWPQSLFAGFMGAFASQFWFLGISLTAAANVRTLALVEVLFAQAVSRRVFGQRVSAREAAGMALVISGVALLVLAP
ncbi:MAG TPA: DMT family transporter [Gammaproteobacteria bacterium]|nr:DMT family transporter [Gammaproteobacteria bacterium]